jgi:hypothetical protein
VRPPALSAYAPDEVVARERLPGFLTKATWFAHGWRVDAGATEHPDLAEVTATWVAEARAGRFFLLGSD